MNRRIAVTLLTSVLVLAPTFARAEDKLSGHPTAAEAAFVQKVSADLTARFPTPEAARKAGYFRFTDEDETGAISYADLKWTSADAEHPSQLWFDAKNRLIGCDFSVPYDAAKRPDLFGIDPSRWQKLGAHVHYGLVGPSGTVYGGAGAQAMAKGGASVAAPTKAALVKAGIAKKTSDVRFVFAFPAIWDVSMWVVPNPNGAFADKNPDVKPVSAPKSAGM